MVKLFFLVALNLKKEKGLFKPFPESARGRSGGSSLAGLSMFGMVSR